MYKGVRAVNLYTPDHAEVDRWAYNMTTQLASAVAIRPSLQIEIRAHSVHLEDDLLQDTTEERETLVERLYADGVRGFTFTADFDKAAALRLLRTLAPYCYADLAPIQPVSDRLHWEPFDGLTFHVQHRPGPGGLAVDALTSRERDWMLRVQRSGGKLADGAMRIAWDVTGGGIPWPVALPAAEAARLDREAEDVVAHRVELDRVGHLMLLGLREWRDDPRLPTLLEPIPKAVRRLVEEGRPGDVGRFVAPLLRWTATKPADHHEMLLQNRLAALIPLMLGDDLLRQLFEDARGRTIAPAELKSFWEALPPTQLASVLEFASVLPDGPNREALIQVVAAHAEDDLDLLHEPVVKGPVGPALVAVDALGCLAPSKEAVILALDALDRPEPALKARALRFLLPMRSRRIAQRILPYATSDRGDVRAAALAYMARYAYRPAFQTLRDYTQSGLFANLDLPGRCEVCRTIGVVGGDDAEKLAWTHLPAGFERLQPDRCVPWIVCLAATGVDAAGEYLDAMAASSDPRVQTIERNTRPLWERRRASRGQLAPPMQTSPGMPIPSAPGFPASGVFERPASGTHRAPSRARTTDPATRAPRGSVPGASVPGAPVRLEEEDP